MNPELENPPEPSQEKRYEMGLDAIIALHKTAVNLRESNRKKLTRTELGLIVDSMLAVAKSARYEG